MTETTVRELPKCDFCDNTAVYDARIPFASCWANVCEECFKKYKCSLGLGKGQKYVLPTSPMDIFADNFPGMTTAYKDGYVLRWDMTGKAKELTDKNKEYIKLFEERYASTHNLTVYAVLESESDTEYLYYSDAGGEISMLPNLPGTFLVTAFIVNNTTHFEDISLITINSTTKGGPRRTR